MASQSEQAAGAAGAAAAKSEFNGRLRRLDPHGHAPWRQDALHPSHLLGSSRVASPTRVLQFLTPPPPRARTVALARVRPLSLCRALFSLSSLLSVLVCLFCVIFIHPVYVYCLHVYLWAARGGKMAERRRRGQERWRRTDEESVRVISLITSVPSLRRSDVKRALSMPLDDTRRQESLVHAHPCHLCVLSSLCVHVRACTATGQARWFARNTHLGGQGVCLRQSV